jgi:hypothetical protein
MLPLSLFIAAFSGQYLGIFWTILGLFLDKFWTEFVKTGRRQQRITLPCTPETSVTLTRCFLLQKPDINHEPKTSRSPFKMG